MRIPDRRHIAHRLVQEQIKPFDLSRDGFAVDADVVFSGIRFCAELGDDLAVDADLTPRDQLLA